MNISKIHHGMRDLAHQLPKSGYVFGRLIGIVVLWGSIFSMIYSRIFVLTAILGSAYLYSFFDEEKHQIHDGPLAIYDFGRMAYLFPVRLFGFVLGFLNALSMIGKIFHGRSSSSPMENMMGQVLTDPDSVDMGDIMEMAENERRES